MTIFNIPLSLFTEEELRILEALMTQINDEHLLDGPEFKAAQVVDGLKLALRMADESMTASTACDWRVSESYRDGDEPGRSYHAHLTATGAAEPDDTRRAGGDV